MTRMILLIVLVGALALSAAGGVTGFFMAAAIGAGFMAARSSLVGLFAALLLALAYWNAITERGTADGTSAAGISRRAVAYVIDLVIAFAVLPPVLAFPLLWLEAGSSGAFHWTFQRTDLVPTDVLVGVPLLLLSIVLLNLYFAYPLVRGTQTPGCYLLGIRIIDFDEAEKVPLGRAALRSFLAFLAACGFFITVPLALWSGQPGVLWYDEMMDTRAVKLTGGS